jgi:hypothetical protein
MATCPKCNGKKYHNCPSCGGSGKIYPFIGSSYTCSNCKGSDSVKCNVCGGKGHV